MARIVIYTHEFLPFSGGIATYCYELACGLRECGHQVVVVAPKRGEVAAGSFPFAVEWIEASDVKALMLRAFFRLGSVVRRFRPAALLATDQYAIYVASIFRFFSKVKCVPILHGTEIIRQTDRRNLLKSFLAWKMSYFYGSAKPVVCISNYTRALFLNAFKVPPENAVVVHNGMKNRFAEGTHRGAHVRREWNISSASTVLLTLARLTPRKGQDTVIKALPRIIEKHPDVVYICAGMGDYGETLKLLTADLGIEDYVVFPGRIPDNEKYSYYAACDLFVMPSREDRDDVEGFGFSFLEAWHASKPVLGSTHGGIPEVITDGVDGVVVDPSDVNAVADAILSLLKVPLRLKEMGRRGHDKACSRFTHVVMANEIVRASNLLE